MRFTKMHGLGNDFVFIDLIDSGVSKETPKDLPDLARKMCDRHFGVGADGLILILPSKKADFRMRIFNPDGSEPEMCGNAIRCFAKYVYEKGITSKKEISIETLGGIKVVTLKLEGDKVEMVTVDMGIPALSKEDIPVIWDDDKVIDGRLNVNGTTFNITCVSMGNPHTVIFVENIEEIEIEKVGPIIETHPIFPKKTNVEFIQVLSENEIRMKVWERGAGVTLACGTGACASTVASILNKKTGRSIWVHLDGGDLFIEWKEDGHIYMSGPATEVFEGDFLL
jgi:diaminopimelate epimerase